MCVRACSLCVECVYLCLGGPPGCIICFSLFALITVGSFGPRSVRVVALGWPVVVSGREISWCDLGVSTQGEKRVHWRRRMQVCVHVCVCGCMGV